MCQVRRSGEAEQDLLDIWDFIAADNLDAADELIDEIASVCERLLQFPSFGRQREELAPGMRSVPVRNYLVFYRVDEEGIVVVRVLHGARDYVGLL